jgi:hypothetical protein
MRQKSEAGALAEVQRHSTGNRGELEGSKYAGCVSCCTTFEVKEIEAWKDEWDAPEKQNRVKRWTAKCARCDKSSVVASSKGLLDDEAYLPTMRHILSLQTANRR